MPCFSETQRPSGPARFHRDELTSGSPRVTVFIPIFACILPRVLDLHLTAIAIAAALAIVGALTLYFVLREP
jgi:hypothetical protein